MGEYETPFTSFEDELSRYDRDMIAEHEQNRYEQARDVREHRADWRSPRRVTADREMWEVLRRAKLGPCRCCGDEWLPQLHHVLARRLGGDDVSDNLVPLCRRCHERIEAHDPAVCSLLRERFTPAEVTYIASKKGLGYLDRRYPVAA